MKEEDFLNHLGQRIRNLRNSKSWTLLDLSALTGIDISDLLKNRIRIYEFEDLHII